MIKRFLARSFLRLTGWEPEGTRPTEPRFVLVGAPHTSNWDLAFFLALITVFDVKTSWMAKHVLFRPPLGWLMRRLGGVPIVRHREENVVSQMARAFEQNESLVLVVAAEGTRKATTHWKSGFYHIARSAGVPIVLGYLDYARRRGGFGPAVHPSGNIERDMDEIRRFYADKVGLHPDQFGEVRLLEESDHSSS